MAATLPQSRIRDVLQREGLNAFESALADIIVDRPAPAVRAAADPAAKLATNPATNLVVDLVMDVAVDRILLRIFVKVGHHAFAAVRLRSSISPDRIPARAKNNTNIP